MTRRLLLASLCATTWAAQPAYFPLETGARWEYRVRTNPNFGLPASYSTRVLSVGEKAERGGRSYYLVRGWATADQWMRGDEKGRLVRWEEASQRELLVVDFDAPLNEPAGMEYRGCGGGVEPRIVSREGVHEVQGVRLGGLVEVSQPGFGPCPGGGVSLEKFHPKWGLVARTGSYTGGGGGSTSWELISASIGGESLSGAYLSFTVAAVLQRAPAGGGEEWILRVRLKVADSTGGLPELYFPSAQRYEITLWSEAGQPVWRYSAGRSFAAVAERVPLAGGEASWTALIPVGGERGIALAPGRYVVAASLACDPADFHAMVPVTLRRD